MPLWDVSCVCRPLSDCPFQRPAMHTAVTSLIHQPELLSKCDTVYQQPQSESSTNAAPQ